MSLDEYVDKDDLARRYAHLSSEHLQKYAGNGGRVPAWIQSWVKPDTITAHSLLPLQHPEERLSL